MSYGDPLFSISIPTIQSASWLTNQINLAIQAERDATIVIKNVVRLKRNLFQFDQIKLLSRDERSATKP